MSLFKNSILPVLLCSLTFACNPRSNLSSPLAAHAESGTEEKEGGITSGGGGTLPAEHPTLTDIGYAINDAKIVLNYYFKFLEKAHHDAYPVYMSKKEYLKLLFDGETTIYDILDTKRPEIIYDKPCLDFAGHEVDGSVRASTRAQYCISASSIAAKISRTDVLVEVTALVAHELSHFLGADENTAVEIQKDLAINFRSSGINESSIKDFVDTKVKAARQRALFLQRYQEAQQYPNQTTEFFNARLYNKYQTDIIGFGDYYATDQTYDKSFALLSESEKQIYNYYQDQTFAIELFVCSQQTLNLIEQARCQKKLEDVFKGRDFVEWQELNRKAPEELKHKPIYRVTSLTASIKLIPEINLYYQIFEFILSGWDGPGYNNTHILSKFLNSSAPNFWDKYIGKYTVTRQNCSADQMPQDEIPKISTLEITPRELGKNKILAMIEKSASAETISYLAWYYENSDFTPVPEFDTQGETTVYLNRAGKSSRQIENFKTTDDSVHFMQTDTIEESPSGLQLKRTRFTLDNIQSSEANPHYFECTYSLAKMP